jgi:hypothetical protein
MSQGQGQNRHAENGLKQRLQRRILFHIVQFIKGKFVYIEIRFIDLGNVVSQLLLAFPLLRVIVTLKAKAMVFYADSFMNESAYCYDRIWTDVWTCGHLDGHL